MKNIKNNPPLLWSSFPEISSRLPEQEMPACCEQLCVPLQKRCLLPVHALRWWLVSGWTITLPVDTLDPGLNGLFRLGGVPGQRSCSQSGESAAASWGASWGPASVALGRNKRFPLSKVPLLLSGAEECQKCSELATGPLWDFVSGLLSLIIGVRFVGGSHCWSRFHPDRSSSRQTCREAAFLDSSH